MSKRPRPSDDTERGFLGRWHERKTRMRDSGNVKPEVPEIEDRLPEETVEQESAREQAGGQEDSAERLKTDEDMPDLDSIDENTDMSDFFSPGVSEQLRNQALRRLWRLPRFNVVDGLDDYAGDYRNFQPLGDIVTSDMRHRIEMEEEKRRALAEAQAAESDEAPEASARAGDRAEDEQAGEQPDGEHGGDVEQETADGGDELDDPESPPRSKA